MSGGIMVSPPMPPAAWICRFTWIAKLPFVSLLLRKIREDDIDSTKPVRDDLRCLRIDANGFM